MIDAHQTFMEKDTKFSEILKKKKYLNPNLLVNSINFNKTFIFNL